ncbi:MAG: ABC transporter permease [Alphaproteobacteria bacterium]|jgi:ABC-2 type transport system permease protein|nr:ABC transporter permease [Alphaproteobacteria bacterium]MDP6815320.1 ABC transporter permease [Alphaproteobacteria bacterium]
MSIVRRSVNPHFSPQRIWGLTIRYVYLLRGSWPRILEMAYWPTVQVFLWGFITQFFAQHSNYIAQAFGVLLSAVLLWDVLFRGQLGVSISFLEEMWSRNLGHLFVAPLRPLELVAALCFMSLLRTLLGVVPATFMAWLFYHYSVYDLGLPLLAFFINLLVMGWAVGIAISGLVLRFGLGAESLAWLVIFALAPISGIYYPIAVLPEWLQGVAFCLPSAHVFEGMRAVLIEGRFDADMMLRAIALNLLYLSIGCGVFLWCFRLARRHALLLQIGE